MSEKNKNSTPNVPKFKFNMYWVYGAIFVVLIGVSFINDASFSTKKISTNKFFKILESNDVIKKETLKILQKYKNYPGYVFNLGHGITPDADPENVQLMIDTVRSM